MILSEVYNFVCASSKKRAHATLKRGRREDRVHAAPAVSCAMCIKRRRTRAYRLSGGSPAFPAQWLYDLYVLSLMTGLSCHHRPQEALASQELDASVGASGPHDFTVRISVARPREKTRDDASRPPHSRPNVRDDGRRPLYRDRMAVIFD